MKHIPMKLKPKEPYTALAGTRVVDYDRDIYHDGGSCFKCEDTIWYMQQSLMIEGLANPIPQLYSTSKLLCSSCNYAHNMKKVNSTYWIKFLE